MAEVERHFVHVAPPPFLAGLEGAHDGVLGGVKVLCGVLVFGRVATADVAALKTEAEVYPAVACPETFFAALGRARGDVADVAQRGVEMCAFCHADIVHYLPVVEGASSLRGGDSSALVLKGSVKTGGVTHEQVALDAQKSPVRAARFLR